MKLKLNSYNTLLTIRRGLGIATILFSIFLILSSIYFIGLFGIKAICYFLYAGTEIIDKFFRILINLF